MFDYRDRYANTDLSDTSKAQRVVLTIFFLLVVAFGIGFMMTGRNQAEVEATLRSKGKRVEAAVSNRYLARSGKNGTAYKVEVLYAVRGIPAHHTFSVTKQAYDGIYQRPSTTLIYLPDDPDVVMLADGGDTRSGSTGMMVGGIIMTVGLALIAAIWIYWIKFCGQS